MCLGSAPYSPLLGTTGAASTTAALTQMTTQLTSLDLRCARCLPSWQDWPNCFRDQACKEDCMRIEGVADSLFPHAQTSRSALIRTSAWSILNVMLYDVCCDVPCCTVCGAERRLGDSAT